MKAKGGEGFRQELGRWGEDLAWNHMAKLGFERLERNWRHRRFEVDLICKKDWEVVFVEVKVRHLHTPVPPENTWTRAQQSRFSWAAHQYMLQPNCRGCLARFDFISILHDRGGWRLDHWVDAWAPLPGHPCRTG
jgi:putative endonuclease